MNGRMYDPVLARFLQPDPVIQDALNTQNYNAYTYVLNNPLKYTDASGNIFWMIPVLIGVGIGMLTSAIPEIAKHGFNLGDYNWGNIIIGGIAGGLGGVAGLGASLGLKALTGITGGFIGGFVSGAAGGAVGGFIQGGFSWDKENGGLNKFNAGKAWAGAGLGALIGGAAGGLVGGISSAIKGNGFWDGFDFKTALKQAVSKESAMVRFKVATNKNIKGLGTKDFKYRATKSNISRTNLETGKITNFGKGGTFGAPKNPISYMTKSAIRKLKGNGLDVLRHEAQHSLDFRSGITDETILEIRAHAVEMLRPATSDSFGNAINKLINYPGLDKNKIQNFLMDTFGISIP